MGKLKDMFNTQIKEFSRYEKKKRWEKTIPKFTNFHIPIDNVNYHGLDAYDLSVIDLLDTKNEKCFLTKAKEIDDSGLILNITCPNCGENIGLNKHWNAFICSCEQDKKIYEISSIESVMNKRPKQVVELKDDGW